LSGGGRDRSSVRPEENAVSLIYRKAGIVARERKDMVLQGSGTHWSAFFAVRNFVRNARIMAEQAQSGEG
jgi:hypothetical protein